MESEKKSNGALVGLIIIVIILIIGGIYLWQTNSINEPLPLGNEETTTNGIDTSSSVSQEETANLEADVNSIDLDKLDSEI